MATCGTQQPGKPDHPDWCTQNTGDFLHRSVEYRITPDERAGVGVELALYGRTGCEYIELMMTKFDGVPPYPVLDVDNNDACNSREPEPVAQGRPWNGKPVMQHPTDPIYVTDPHAHDLTLDQAAELYRALGELLTMARARPLQPVKGAGNGPGWSAASLANAVPTQQPDR